MTEKTQKHNFPKYNLDADFWRNRWCEASAEALQQQLEYIKLEKKLATAVKALEKIDNLPECKHDDDWSDNLDAALEICSNALAEIGGEEDE